MPRKLFCQLSPLCYRISVFKENRRRDLWDLLHRTRFAKRRQAQPLPALVKAHRSLILRQLKGVDPQLQKNKQVNLALAAARINGLLIRPGETFSFWHTVGDATARRGYRKGLTISNGRLGADYGGGLCQMANLLHWMVLHSPLTVTELHHHTDAIFPDEGRRVPFGTGTSIFYKNVDYRFKNETGTTVQLLVWLADGDLCGELRAAKPFAQRYRIVEEDHHFAREADGEYYRNSRIYRLTLDAAGQVTDKTLLLQNHSRVLYDPALIPPEQLRG